MNNLAKPLIAFAGFLAVVILGWQWVICRVYVQPGEILVITSKFGDANPDPDNTRVVPEGTQGVLRDVRGEGRHFYNPIEYVTDTTSTVVDIPPDSMAVVESMSGKPLPAGEFLAEEGFKGILRKPLGPGKWRLNPFAYKVTKIPATTIKPGSVGCVTALAGDEPPEGQLAEAGQRGVQKNVLQPGIYYLNPREFKIDQVWVGYQEITLENVSFPSSDGFTIQLDITVVWGLEPKDVPTIISRLGNVEVVEDKKEWDDWLRRELDDDTHH